MYLLKESRKLGNYLVVGLNTDKAVRKLKGEGRPIEEYKVRKRKLLATGLVDKVVPIGVSPMNQIIKNNVDIIVVGDDYKPEQVIGYGYAKVQILRRLPGVSTTGSLKARCT